MCSLKASKRHYIVQARKKRVIFGSLIFGRFFFFFLFFFFFFFRFSFTAMIIADNWRGEQKKALIRHFGVAWETGSRCLSSAFWDVFLGGTRFER